MTYLIGHQSLLMNKRILHRDVSRANILTEPKHHDLRPEDLDYEGKEGNVPYIPIEAVLEGANGYVLH